MTRNELKRWAVLDNGRGQLSLVTKPLDADSHVLEGLLSWLFAVGKIENDLPEVDEQIETLKLFIKGQL